MAYNPIPLLVRQFKSLATLESRLDVEERKSHQWQLLVTLGDTVHIISKGGANTIVYTTVKNGVKSQPNYYTPVQMLDLLEEMQKTKYVEYRLVSGGKVRKSSTDIRDLLVLKPKRASVIYGITPTNQKVPLQEWAIGVFEQSWKPAKTKPKRKPRR